MTKLSKDTKKFLAIVASVAFSIGMLLEGISLMSVESEPAWLNFAKGIGMIASAGFVWWLVIIYVKKPSP